MPAELRMPDGPRPCRLGEDPPGHALSCATESSRKSSVAVAGPVAVQRNRAGFIPSREKTFKKNYSGEREFTGGAQPGEKEARPGRCRLGWSTPTPPGKT